MTECARILDDLKADCDHEIGLLRRLAVRRHLAHCARCRKERNDMEHTRETLQSAETDDATALDPALRARILAQVWEKEPPRRAPALRDRLLSYCFAGSVAVNFGFALLLSRADLFGGATQTPTRDMHRMPVRVYHPPVKAPPKPPVKVVPPKLTVTPPRRVVQRVRPVPKPPVLPPAPPRQPPPVGSRVAFKQPDTWPVGPADSHSLGKPALPDNGEKQKPTVDPPSVPIVPPRPPVKPDLPAKTDNTPQWENQSADVTPSAPIGDWPRPEPPSDMDASSITGSCVLRVSVSEQGRVARVQITQSSGSAEFDRLCADAVKRIRFQPAIQDGVARAAQYDKEYTFGG